MRILNAFAAYIHKYAWIDIREIETIYACVRVCARMHTQTNTHTPWNRDSRSFLFVWREWMCIYWCSYVRMWILSCVCLREQANTCTDTIMVTGYVRQSISSLLKLDTKNWLVKLYLRSWSRSRSRSLGHGHGHGPAVTVTVHALLPSSRTQELNQHQKATVTVTVTVYLF